MTPKFKITPEHVETYADMFDVPLSAEERAKLPEQLAGGFAGIADLWAVDVAGCEPAVILPVDRSARK
jgi:hypothetical protein